MKIKLSTMLRTTIACLSCLFAWQSASAQFGYCQERINNAIDIRTQNIRKNRSLDQFIVGKTSSSSNGDDAYFGIFGRNGTERISGAISVTPEDDAFMSATRAIDNSMIAVGYAGHRYTYGERVSKGLPLCTNESKVYVAKISDMGNLVWQRTLNKGCDDYGYDVVSDGTDRYWILGNHYASSRQVYDIYLIRITDAGSAQTEKSISSPNAGSSYLSKRIVRTNDGGYAILAQERSSNFHPYSRTTFYPNYNANSLVLIKLNSAMNVTFARSITYPASFGPVGIDGTDLMEMPNGDLVVIGTLDFAGAFDLGLVVKFDAAGTRITDALIDLDLNANISTVPQALNRKGANQIFITGYTMDAFDPFPNTFLLELDANLNLITASGFGPGELYGAIKHTAPSGLRIFMAGRRNGTRQRINMVKKPIGVLNCCENTPTPWFDRNRAIVTNTSVIESGFVTTDPQTPTAPINTFTTSNQNNCPASSKRIDDTELPAVREVRLYPNPAANQVTLRVPADQEGAALQLFDGQGRSILNRTLGLSEEVFDLSGLVDGVYFFRIQKGTQIQTEKLVVRH
ncbi:MAG: T9SS type A sorting domain-containing protein [Bacteroidota bacterium]